MPTRKPSLDPRTARAAVRRLCRMYRGLARVEPWYPREAARIGRMAEDAGIEPRAAILAAAIASPAVGWDVLLERLPALLEADSPARIRGVPGYSRNLRKAWRAKAGELELDGVCPRSSPKVHRFARNLLGDHECVTVDRWAIRAALGPDGAEPYCDGVTLGVYRALEDVYQRAARRCQVEPALLQSATWEALRGSARGA